MRILVLGGNGMAGHMIVHYLKVSGHGAWSTQRTGSRDGKWMVLDVRNPIEVYRTIQAVRPNVVVNAVGLLNETARINRLDAITVNSLLPNWLARWGTRYGFRVIHISTDCVFSGTTGPYRETDYKDGNSVYAQTKSLGEISEGCHATIRTSIVGPELNQRGIGLFHWFMKQTGDVAGYVNVFWNGVTTLHLAKCVAWMLDKEISGVVHLTGQRTISKYELLGYLKASFSCTHQILAVNGPESSDKTLINTRTEFNWPTQDYSEMMSELYAWMCQNRTLYSPIYQL